MTNAQLSFPALTGTLKAAAEPTRLRLLMLIGEAELTVTDLTAILRQSQPRLSRHLRLLAEAGLVERHREGSWAFFRLGEAGGTADIARALIARLDPNDPVIARDRERLAARAARTRRSGAELFPPARRQWDRIRQTTHRRHRRRRSDPRGAWRPADPRAARSRHRHRTHARTFRRRHRTRPWVSTYHSTCWRLPAPGWIVPD